MTRDPDIELISFRICPFVARAAIVAAEKGIEPTITYIDLSAKPRWFLELCPTGEVPVLRIGKLAIFESSAIAEYFDERHEPRMLPRDIESRAESRSWIAFASRLIFKQYAWMIATSIPGLEDARARLRAELEHLETRLDRTPYFNGEAFGIIDAAYAPLLVRFLILSREIDHGLLNALPRAEAWAAELSRRPSVRAQFGADFESAFYDHLGEKQSVLLGQMPRMNRGLVSTTDQRGGGAS